MRSGALLLDARPKPESVSVAIQTSEGLASLGSLTYERGFIDTISRVRDSINSVVGLGLYAEVKRVEYQVLEHMESLADWENHWEKEREYYEAPNESVINAIHDALREPAEELVLNSWIEATLLRRKDYA